MKKFLAFLLVALLIAAMTGCSPAMPATTNPSTVPSTTAPTQSTTEDTTLPTDAPQSSSVQILATIWQSYSDDERFAVYGGAVENSVADAPGALDITNTEELTGRYLMPQEQLSSVNEAASLVHMMNNNIFTAVVFRLNEDTKTQTVATALRDTVQGNQWICGQPDKLILADMKDGHLLMVYGSNDAVNTFKTRLSSAYAEAAVLYEENIVA